MMGSWTACCRARKLGELRLLLLRSEEFRERAPALLPALPMAPMRLQIELDAGAAVLDAMLARTGDYWAGGGAGRPRTGPC
jgi:hypothetical protein